MQIRQSQLLLQSMVCRFGACISADVGEYLQISLLLLGNIEYNRLNRIITGSMVSLRFTNDRNMSPESGWLHIFVWALATLSNYQEFTVPPNLYKLSCTRSVLHLPADIMLRDLGIMNCVAQHSPWYSGILSAVSTHVVSHWRVCR